MKPKLNTKISIGLLMIACRGLLTLLPESNAGEFFSGFLISLSVVFIIAGSVDARRKSVRRNI